MTDLDRLVQIRELIPNYVINQRITLRERFPDYINERLN